MDPDTNSNLKKKIDEESATADEGKKSQFSSSGKQDASSSTGKKSQFSSSGKQDASSSTAKKWVSGPSIEEDPVMDTIDLVYALHHFFYEEENNVFGSILTPTSQKLFLIHLINQKRRNYNLDVVFSTVLSLRHAWIKNQYDDDQDVSRLLDELWEGDNYTSKEFCSDVILEAELLELTDDHLDPLVRERLEKESELLSSMVNFFHGPNKWITEKDLKSSEQIEKYLNGVVVPNAPKHNVRGACLEARKMMSVAYNSFKNFKLSETTSKIEFDNFDCAFDLWGHDYDATDFEDDDNDDDDDDDDRKA